jgi:phage tail sheath protein FI
MRLFCYLLLAVFVLSSSAFAAPSFPKSIEVHTAAFVDAYPKGPVNHPVLVHGMQEFEATFGGESTLLGANNRAYLQVRQFFQNGGVQAWIDRIAPPDWVGSKSAHTGIYAFTQPFDLLVMPGVETLPENEAGPARDAAVELANEKNAFLVLDAPSSVDFNGLLAWRAVAQELFQQKRVAVYFPRIQIIDPALQKAVFLASSASVAGIMSAQKAWVSPAGLIPIVDATDVEHKITDDMTGKMMTPTSNGVAINPIRIVLHHGIVPFGARTCDANSTDFRYIQQVRTGQYIEKNASQIMQAYVFSPNSAMTWAHVRGVTSDFLTELWKDGGLVGATSSQAFSVAIGLGSTMTSEDILQGNMIMQVTAALIQPAEFTTYTFTQKMETP